ncbi:MAG TPA: hypothetical protein VN939_11130 [Chthoniobacterales bacterium]|nr:hypothetical protein [Chthoniobacterales bacterium]
MAVKERLEAEGRLVCHRGYIKGYQPAEEQVEVTYRPRGTSEEKKLGSTQKGRLYESTAVPELRGQAADLAERLLGDLTK